VVPRAYSSSSNDTYGISPSERTVDCTSTTSLTFPPNPQAIDSPFTSDVGLLVNNRSRDSKCPRRDVRPGFGGGHTRSGNVDNGKPDIIIFIKSSDAVEVAGDNGRPGSLEP